MGYVEIALTIFSHLDFFTRMDIYFLFDFSPLNISGLEKQTVPDML